MLKLIKRMNLLVCDCCGEPILVDDNELVDLIYKGEVVAGEEMEEDLDDCDGDCFNCELCI